MEQVYPKKLEGVVVSDRMTRTAVVLVTRLQKYPKYKKYKAHDEKDEYKVGDKVMIQETRPLSKDKRWIITGKL